MHGKKKSIVCLLLISCFLIGFVIKINGKKLITQSSECIPVFSLKSGFYEDGQEIRLTTRNGWEVYYTLDSTDPRDSRTAKKYSEPIHVGDATRKPNRYSMIEDVSLGYQIDKVEEITGEKYEGITYKTPQYLVDKCTVIRACAKNGAHTTPITTAVYFIGFNEKVGYQNINVMSVVTDPDNLFDSEKGIYALGRTWQEYCSKNKLDSKNWSWWPGNFSAKYIESERQATIHFFDRDRMQVASQDIGIRIQGNSSRAYSPKSLNLYAREEYGKKHFPDLFGNSYQAKRLTLFAGSQDYGTKIRDALVHDLAKDRKVLAKDYIPCALFLDGEYWGFYFLTEKDDEQWISHNYNIPDDQVVIVKNKVVEAGHAEELKYYNECMDFLATADMTREGNYQKACEMMDMENLARYYSIMIYINRRDDWPLSNKELWRAEGRGNNSYQDGKWRYMLYDLNSWSLDIRMIGEDSIAYVIDQDSVFANMCRNSGFIDLFIRSMLDIINNAFSYEAINERVDHYKQLMTEPMKVNNKRFFGSEEYTGKGYFDYPEDGETFEDKIETIRSFLIDRRFTVINVLNNHFKVNVIRNNEGAYVYSNE